MIASVSTTGEVLTVTYDSPAVSLSDEYTPLNGFSPSDPKLSPTAAPQSAGKSIETATDPATVSSSFGVSIASSVSFGYGFSHGISNLQTTNNTPGGSLISYNIYSPIR